jgi:hypothetical protein
MSKTYEYICNYCKKSFQTTRKYPLNAKTHYCSKDCSISAQKLKSYIENKKDIKKNCVYCGNEILVSLHDIKVKQKLNQHFYCSQSCNARYNNEHRNFSPEKQLQINEKIRNSLKGRIYRKPRICIICNKEIPNIRKGKTCCIECEKQYKKIRHAHVGGGYRQGSSRGHHGYYKGYWCDSTYELAYLIYCLDHNIKIERCKESFEYEIDGKKRKYHPDFIVDNEIIEIKNFHREDVEIKINAVKKLNRKIKVLYYEDLIEIFEYVAKTYKKEFKNKSNNFYELYEK